MNAFNDKFNLKSNYYNDYYNYTYISQQVIDESTSWLGDLKKDTSKLERIHEIMKYINEKIYDDENNIDKNFTKISKNNEYVKSYLGFENEESIKNFKRIVFSLYKIIFPNYTAMIFSIICLILFIFLIVLNIISIYYSIQNERFDKLKKYNIVFSIILYCPTFLGYLIYCSVIYKKVYNSESIEYAKKVRADKFIEDFLKEFIKYLENKTLILCSIIFFIFSGILFIIGWIISSFNESFQNYRINRLRRRHILESHNTIPIRTIDIAPSSRQNEEILAVIFISIDRTINLPVACKPSDKFSEIEKKLYIEYPDLEKKNIYFVSNGKVIEKLNTLKQNDIRNGNAILTKDNELD